MRKRKMATIDAAELRRRAEERLNAFGRREATPSSEVDARRLVHELEVHRIELEMQNKELMTARAEAEQGLERYTALFDFAPICYASLAADETIRGINHAGAHLLGWDRSRLIGLGFGSFVVAGHRSTFRTMLGRAFDSGDKETCEVELVRAGHASIQVRMWASVLARAERTILLACEDVTERKREEEKLIRTEAALREADARKDEFLAVLSHELRNPLTPIRNSLHVLARAQPGGEQAREAYRIIDRQVTHLSHLVDDLLDVTRIAHGKIHLQREHVELAELVRRMMDDHRSSFEASGIHLEERFEPGAFWVQADPSRLSQALSNLLGNAQKFTPRGGSVSLALHRHGRRVSIQVRDTGAGIAPEFVQHLFEPFSQAPQTMDRARGGLGLGLAMARGLVELQGGRVDITSNGTGRGTEVTVSLPLEPPPPATAPADRQPAMRSRRVLVIDDNPEAADSLKTVLEFGGHDVAVAYNGPSGLELARQFRPEIVICDIGLPGMNGYEVARAFRADDALRAAHLVALTGYVRKEDRQRAADAGFDRHVGKPPNLEELDRLLAEAPALEADEDASSALPKPE